MEVNREKLLTQIKEAHGKVLYTYTAHHKIADRTKRLKTILEWIEIVITAASAVGLLSGFISNITALKLIGGLCSTVSLAITLYTKNDTLQAIIKEHTDAANELWLVREKYQSLITDFDGLETSQIQSDRTAIMLEVDQINRKYPGTDSLSYKAAQKALKKNEEQYFAPGETDKLLPHNQNVNNG
jgi:hypothetical protein